MLVRSCLVALAVAGMSVSCSDGPSVPASSGPVGEEAGARATEPRALRVLHAWDARRAAAYSRGDVAALRRLYTRGSAEGEQDVAVLRQYVDRGLTVDGLRMQVLTATVVRDRDRVVSLELRERLVSGRAVGPRGAVRLPAERVGRHAVTLVRRGGDWVVRSATRW